MPLRFMFAVVFFFCIFFLQSPCNAQVVDKVKETTIEKVEEKAVEETEKISDAIFEKLEGLFKKKNKKTEESEDTPAKKEENEAPKTVKKSKYIKNS